jgi:hypothetical protein
MVVSAPSRAQLASVLLAAVLLPALPLMSHARADAGAAASLAPTEPAVSPHGPSATGYPQFAPTLGPIHYMDTVETAALKRTLRDNGVPLVANAAHAKAASAVTSNLPYNGGPIQKYPHVYLVFWNFLTSFDDPSGEQSLLPSFFGKVGGTGWADIQTQYDDTVRGYITDPAVQFNPATDIWVDTSLTNLPPFPRMPDQYIANEAIAAESHFTALYGYNQDDQYIIASPHERNSVQFGVSYCAWHTYTTDSSNRAVPFTNLPYMTDGGASCGANFVSGPLDGVTIVSGHEYAETVTDPQLNAWVDTGNQENGDKCAWVTTGPGRTQLVNFHGTNFPVQGLWSNADSDCEVSYSASLTASANGPYSA